MPRPADAADALALAICHVWRGGTTARLNAAVEAAARSTPQRQRVASAASQPRSRRPRMIAQLSGHGRPARSRPRPCIEVGGFGLLAVCSPEHRGRAAASASSATLATSLVVREDSLTLYGFASADEREFFELLLTATGVGPKLAQAALAVLSPDELRRAIATENLVQLCKVPGHRPQGRPADRHRAQGQDQHRRPRRDPSAPRRRSPVGLAGPGDPGTAGLGWSAEDAEAACDEVEHLVARATRRSVSRS